jgi:hypothetical protein
MQCYIPCTEFVTNKYIHHSRRRFDIEYSDAWIPLFYWGYPSRCALDQSSCFIMRPDGEYGETNVIWGIMETTVGVMT